MRGVTNKNDLASRPSGERVVSEERPAGDFWSFPRLAVRVPK